MAFHQPTARQPYQRAVRPEPEEQQVPQALAPQVRSGPDESQTWVLFSPATGTGTTTSYLSSLRHTQPTPGRSRLSDDGSFVTYARSDRNSQPQNSAVPSEISHGEEAIEDDAELDSLDSHLPEFRTLLNHYSESSQQPAGHAAPVLPRHDGLGSFLLDANGMSGADMQDRLYAFERYNPRRVKRRRESLELSQFEVEEAKAEEVERMRRVERWRLEHSQSILAEIQKETRRRRLSEASFQKLRARLFDAEEVATMSAVGDSDADTPMASSDWHDQDESRGFWALTRRLIRDLMGIDYKLLSILFRDALPDVASITSPPKASAPARLEADSPAPEQGSESQYDSTWHLRMLERIARELGLLVHQMSTHHPGAFATYLRVQHMPLPYAGLPVIPEAAAADVSQFLAPENKADEGAESMLPQFKPTIPTSLHIGGATDVPSAAADPVSSASANQTQAGNYGAATFTQTEWEQDLDIRLVFRYLRSRFNPSRSSASPSFTGGTSYLATCSTQDAAAKAARVRQYHPLVSRTRNQAERRPFKPAAAAAPLLFRHASGSCASQSTRRSARQSSASSRHSSRHYWDIGAGGPGPAGSIGTGSMVASAGPMGSWGEI